MRMNTFVEALKADEPVCFFIGAMAKGEDSFADSFGVDDRVAVSQYSLSASVVCGKTACAFEELWGVL
jgi:rRNA small subunit pseudouridine methyltransferase Nep1